MCGSKVNSYTGCGHTFMELWKCRPVRDLGQPVCRHWDALNREHPQALPQNCPDCERRPFDASRWREIGIQPQDPVFTRIGSVADRYVPTPPPPPPASRHPSGYIYGEDQTRAGAGSDPTPSEIDRRVLNWGRDVPHPTGYDTRYTPVSPERASTNGTQLYNAPRQSSTRAESHTSRQSSVGAQQALAPRRRLDVGPGHSGYENADDYNRRLSEYHYNGQPARTLPMRPLPVVRAAPPALPTYPSVGSVAGSSRGQSIYRPAAQLQQQPAPPSIQQPVQQPDFSNAGTGTGTGTGTSISTGTSTGTLTNGGSVSGYSPTATRRGAGSHGGSGGMSYFRGPASGPGTNRRIY
ncbi:hypothetical protein D6D01_07550 [Aureobasidium pullulans]|uniref:Uncharacterized protein n=1 Tax=Aureobasidium pullulans TaxID=5580 RepID=A0A4V4JTB3_AURPU|nr:hypothetical protein D6D01_07550 [Aureobasidium pullulans]